MYQIINDFLGNIFVALGVLLFSKIVLATPIKTTKIKLIIYFILSIISYTIIMIYTKGTLKTLLMAMTMVIFNRKTYKEPIRKCIFITFIYMTVLIAAEILQLYTLTKVLGISKDYCYSFAGSIMSNAMILIILLSLTLILKKILKKLAGTKVIENTKIILLTILTLISTIIYFYIIIKEFKAGKNIIANIISMVTIIAVLYTLIKEAINNNTITKKYDKLLDNMTTYENEIEKQRIQRHEAKNEMRTIKAKLIDNQPKEEIIEYIEEIVNEKYEVAQEKYAKFGYLPANGIKGLCYFKMEEAEANGLIISINISSRIKNSSVYNLTTKEQRDFGRILGVYLDNAIEASKESERKQLGIEAYTNKEKEFKLIISNTYNNKIDKNKLGKEKYSNKGKNRGHGLLLVSKLINNNQIFESQTTIQEDIYIQTITIKKREEQ